MKDVLIRMQNPEDPEYLMWIVWGRRCRDLCPLQVTPVCKLFRERTKESLFVEQLNPHILRVSYVLSNSSAAKTQSVLANGIREHRPALYPILRSTPVECDLSGICVVSMFNTDH